MLHLRLLRIDLLLLGVFVANQSQLGVGGALQRQGNVVKAGLGFVVHASGRFASRSKLTEHRLEAIGAGGGGGIGGPIHSDRRRLGVALAHVVHNIAGHGDRGLLPAATLGAVRVAVEAVPLTDPAVAL